ncbi:MAG: hypothetical protein ACI4LB_01015 [Candidatus Fimenecus sp.]
MDLEKVTDLSYAEKTLLGKYRLCSDAEKAEIRAQIQEMLAKDEQPDVQADTPNA